MAGKLGAGLAGRSAALCLFALVLLHLRLEPAGLATGAAAVQHSNALLPGHLAERDVGAGGYFFQ